MESVEIRNLLASIKAKTADHALMKKANLKHRSEIRNAKTKESYPFSKKTVTQSYAKLQRMKSRLMRLQDEEAEAKRKAAVEIDPSREVMFAEARVQSGIFTWEHETIGKEPKS